jgi:hypothetical protein
MLAHHSAALIVCLSSLAYHAAMFDISSIKYISHPYYFTTFEILTSVAVLTQTAYAVCDKARPFNGGTSLERNGGLDQKDALHVCAPLRPR